MSVMFLRVAGLMDVRGFTGVGPARSGGRPDRRTPRCNDERGRWTLVTGDVYSGLAPSGL
jgi:hypothetical protein